MARRYNLLTSPASRKTCWKSLRPLVSQRDAKASPLERKTVLSLSPPVRAFLARDFIYLIEVDNRVSSARNANRIALREGTHARTHARARGPSPEFEYAFPEGRGGKGRKNDSNNDRNNVSPAIAFVKSKVQRSFAFARGST